MTIVGSSKVAEVLLVFLLASCAVVSQAYTPAVNFPATMTLKGFQKGEGGGRPAACDGQFHSDQELIVSLSAEYFAGGARCGKYIRIVDYANLYITAKVVDECVDCVSEVGASTRIWQNFNLDPSVGDAPIRWSDAVVESN